MINALCVIAAVLSLNGDWRLDAFPQPDAGAVRSLPLPSGLQVRTVTATVPGNCELDLVRAGDLPVPEVGLNARLLRPYEGYQWLYARAFEKPSIPSGGRVLLCFDGVDTLADYFLNGEKIGESSNMLIPHRFDITSRLRDGMNTVQVLLRSVMCEAQDATLGELGYSMSGGADGEPFRKAGHMGGWDILPRAFVSGLWRDVSLRVEGPVQIDQTAWIVRSLDAKRAFADLIARCRVRSPFSTLDHAKIVATLTRNGRLAAKAEQTLTGHFPNLRLRLDRPDLWWPRGFGEPALYEARFEVQGDDGRVLASHAEKIGVRTVELVREDVYGPERPGQFLFKINGEPCYVRGSNWVPLDAIPSRQKDRIVETLELFKDLNCNMVRVWGGGVYEPDAFFDWCDANGLMVWQDFMTGCSVFPQGDDYAKQTEAEARSVILRLRNRASLVLWSGNNENDQAASWQLGALGRDPNGDRNSRRTLADVIYEFDVTRPYLPSSPYVSPDVFTRRAQPSEDHLWGARGAYKTDYYTNSPAWFVSEMGYHGCPNRASLERMMTASNVYPWVNASASFLKNPSELRWNDEWVFKAVDWRVGSFGQRRNSLMTNQVRLMFGGVETDLDTFIAQSQFVQAEAMKTFCELFRSRKFTRSNGLIWWNVRDGWPVISDAVVDWYGGKKRAYFALKNAQRDQIVCVTDDHKAWAVNDARRPIEGTARLTDLETETVLLEKTFRIPANGKVELGAVAFSGQGVIQIDATLDGKPYVNHFLYGEPPFDWKRVKKWLPDALTDETAEIQGQIDAVWRQGGGTVEIAPGVHRISSLRVRSNVTLHLLENAVLSASRDLDAYDILEADEVEPLPPGVLASARQALWLPIAKRSKDYRNPLTNPAARWNRGVIRLVAATNVVIRGERGSVIDGNNSFDPQGEEGFRGAHGINAFGSTNVLVRGIELRRTGNWANHFNTCADLCFENLTIRGGHDGVHMRGCDRVTVRNCDIRCGDDCIAGYDNTDVLVEDCRLNTACSAFRFGGTHVRVRRVKVWGPGEWPIRNTLPRADQIAGNDCQGIGRHNLLSFWTYFADFLQPIRNPPGDIVVEDCEIDGADRFLHYNFSGNEIWQKGAPLADIAFCRVKARNIGQPLNVWADARVPLVLRLNACEMAFRDPVREFMRGAYVRLLDLRDVRAEGVDGPVLLLWKTEELHPELRLKDVQGFKLEARPTTEKWDVTAI